MEQYAGIDVSLEASHVCVVDAQGKIVKEAKVASEPDGTDGHERSFGRRRGILCLSRVAGVKEGV